MKKNHWYHYLWIWSIIYFGLGFVNILFAWLGLITFCLPLFFAIFGGNKLFCNRYCDRGQLLRVLGSQAGLSRRCNMPHWLHGRAFRYAFMVFFFAMFGNILYMTWLAVYETDTLQDIVMLLWSIQIPWNWTYSPSAAPWMVQFSFGLYSLMLTSEIIALVAMFCWRARAWCTFCPMGTLTQAICKIKNGKS